MQPIDSAARATARGNPAPDLRRVAMIDAGHGGVTGTRVGLTYGSPVAGPDAKAIEQHINFDIAQRVCAQLGHQAVLTRGGDYALALRERIERARGAGAAAFVSIHSNTGRSDRDGPEVWIYGRGRAAANAQSLQLALRIGAELATTERAAVPVRIGDLALLRPELHGRGVAACLVESGSLNHARGAARLSDPRTLDGIGRAVSRGVARYLADDYRGGDGSPRYGSVVLESPPARDAARPAVLEPPRRMRPVRLPAQACYHDGAEAMQANWWDTPLPVAALTDTAPPELRRLLALLAVSYATFAPREGAYFAALTEHLRRAGVVPAGTTLDRSSFADGVREFQSRRRLTMDGLPGEQTLWALQRDWAAGRRLAVRRVAADQHPGSGGFDHFRLREDIVDRYDALRTAVLAAGGIITSAGSFRELTANVTAGRSSTSMHYSGLALDLATDTGMRNPARDPYLVAREGRKWRVWCRSETAPERQIDAVRWHDGAVTTAPVTARAFDFTALAEANGFTSIPPRRAFPADYMAAEWWHFQCELPLVPYVSQFGIELLSLALYDEAHLARHTELWSNRARIFKRGRSGWY